MKRYPMSERVIKDLGAVEDALVELVSFAGDALAETALDTLKAGGKRLRPALVLMSGQVAGYSLNRLLPAAMAVELVHMASLAHDDVLDKADIRRGQPTVYAVLGERMASAVGDFLFARAFESLAGLSDLRALTALSDASVALCLGEFEQMRTAHVPDQPVEVYLDKISRKTAALFEACCKLGGILTGADDVQIDLLGAYGHDLGMAFQIYDDILDFTGGAELGKPVGTDLRDGTVTMPMLYALEDLEDDRSLREVIEAHAPEEAAVAKAIEQVIASDGLRRSKEEARGFVDRAMSEARRLENKSLAEQLAAIGEFVIDRYH